MKSYPLSVAPMMGYSTRHGRYFWRLLSADALLYTEMIVAPALLRGQRARLLQYHPGEQPLALQIAGSKPDELAQAASIGEAYGFCEINLNAGCPSQRVQQAGIGAILMRDTDKLADLAAAMRAKLSVPVSVKCRIAIDQQDSEPTLDNLARNLSAAGISKLIVHARRGLLRGLSPKANRQIPQLDYQRVYRLQRSFPAMEIILNGGLHTLEQVQQSQSQVAGVMIARAACSQPWLLAELQQHFFGDALPERASVIAAMQQYAQLQINQGHKRSELFKLAVNLYRNEANAKAQRRHLLQA